MVKVLSRFKRRPSSSEMSLIEHLAELRRRLVVILGSVFVTSILAYLVYNRILNFFLTPYCSIVGSDHCNLYVTGPLDGFALRIKVSIFGGIALAIPIILWELWRFITPGLHRNEKRYAIPFVVVSVLLFACGAYIAYLTFPHALRFLSGAAGPHLTQIYSPSSYLNLILLLMAAFGVAFEFPVLLVSLEIAGVVTPKRLSEFRRWAIVIIFAADAIFIPSSDPFSLFAMALPMVLFYEIAIVVGRIILRSKRKAAAAAVA
ncbi:MAG: twin-arginine translocase subunit TatC [Actinomycetota bacterium]|nr:MAG: twin-arginine translocase subunit TatC [Actinomycetota bacterium]